MDIYIWISCSRCGYLLENIYFRVRDIYIYVFRYHQRYPYALFRYLHVDNLFKMWISINGYGYPYCNYDKTDILGKYLHKPIYMYGYIHRYPHIYLYIMDIHTQLALMNSFTKGRYSALGIGRATALISRAHQDRSFGGHSHTLTHIHRNIQAHISTQVRTEIPGVQA